MNRLILALAALVAAGALAHAQPDATPTTTPSPATAATGTAGPDVTPPRPLTETEIAGLVALGAVALVFTFAPAALAAVRGHRSTAGIFLVCLFFGWTCLGWVVALVWAASDTGRRR